HLCGPAGMAADEGSGLTGGGPMRPGGEREEASDLETVSLDLGVELRAGDAQKSGGFGAVVAGILKRLDDQLPLDILQFGAVRGNDGRRRDGRRSRRPAPSKRQGRPVG